MKIDEMDIAEAMAFAEDIRIGKPLGPTYCEPFRAKALGAILTLSDRVTELCGELATLIFSMNGWFSFAEVMPDEQSGDKVLVAFEDGSIELCKADCFVDPGAKEDPASYAVFDMEKPGLVRAIYWMPLPDLPDVPEEGDND